MRRYGPYLGIAVLLAACATTSPTGGGSLTVSDIRVDAAARVVTGTVVNSSGRTLGLGGCAGELQVAQGGDWVPVRDPGRICPMYLGFFVSGQRASLTVPIPDGRSGCGYRVHVGLAALDQNQGPRQDSIITGASVQFCLD